MLVDTSAWVEWLRGTGANTDLALRAMLDRDEDLATTGLVVQEVLQGCRDERQAADLKVLLTGLRCLDPVYPQTFEHAAALFRRCRRAGRTVRGTVDCLVAALAIEHDLPLLARDRDFESLQAVCGLRLNADGR